MILQWVVAVAFWLATLDASTAAWKNVAEEWDKYRLNDAQKEWFKSLHPKRPGPACCDQADGHPTDAEQRADGFWYVPNPYHTDWPWVKVPEDALTIPANNPIGVPTVWYGAENPDGTPFIRCFVPGSDA